MTFRSLLKTGLIVLLLTLTSPLFSITFRYKYPEGEEYRIVSEQQQMVLFNGEFDSKSDILVRILVEILNQRKDGGHLEIKYQLSEQMDGQDSYQFQNEESIQFNRDFLGVYSGIPENSLSPNTRHVPTFPEGDVQPGDKWHSPGEEVQNLRLFFSEDVLLTLPFNVFYTYIGPVEVEGRTYEKIKIEYNIFQPLDPLEITIGEPQWEKYFPVEIQSSYKIELLWDNQAGRPYSLEDQYIMDFTMSNGDVFTFKGISRGQAFYAAPMEKEKMTEEIEEDIIDIEDVKVEQSDEGLKLTLENIQFRPDSAILLESEMSKLQQISEVLKRYSDRDIMIVGHAARLGKESWLQQLSEMRAASVAEYFIDHNIRKKSRITSKGMGSREPIADNDTDMGRSRNRRVEIIILEN